ncbi:uncharacterized protein LOC127882296 [Dreissena polymorpha]|uniref:Uncharacterized protein n=1 Tax=Dreissena polymorpha TaxID=45954 RepID=A0A9D4GSB3_DREPO|nr:uncharacterized protein LOC127882296 [Dreissena polymorpha]XP_052286819.1 uncharacterized protein LOC127882296 [Dreissena polymorpha]XP_052286820.1 uncharacterized protein LOC127882296 [Dreissena polymorpha]KAH3822175.1 hypothetical protein DPMN_123946 [Dreissena polymorpha]
MNYLETGLPHTEFYPRKTQFSPPRFIPLCTLGRKYLGLEPMSKQEVHELVKRLSEPKKAIELEEPISGNDVRPLSASSVIPGTGRFVGRKKMNGFEIEKMVERLYSRRPTKDYAFVDEDATEEDIMNMTNRTDEDEISNSDNESGKDLKERENLIRRQSSAIIGCSRPSSSANVLSKNKQIVHSDFRRDSLMKLQSTSVKDDESNIDLDAKHRLNLHHKASVTFQRETPVAECRGILFGCRNPKNQLWRGGDPSSESKPKPILKRSVTVYGNSYMSPYGRRTQIASSDDKSGSTRFLRPKSEPSPMYAPRSEFTETTFTRIALAKSAPSSHRLSPSARLVSTKALHMDTPRSSEGHSANVTPRATPRQVTSSTVITIDIDDEQLLPSIENKERKLPKYSEPPPDEHLIDRVAIYNRSPRLRCK